MAAVSLTYDDDVLAGTVGDAGVRLVLDVPNSRAGVHGTCLGHDVDGYWQVGSNFGNPAPAARFLGRCDDEPVSLHAQIQLGALTSLRFADLTGSIGDRELRARIVPVEAPAHGPIVLSVDGTFDGAVITLYASATTGRARAARIEGNVGGRVVRLTTARRAPGTSVTGEYDAVPELFALFVGVLLYFP